MSRNKHAEWIGIWLWSDWVLSDLWTLPIIVLDTTININALGNGIMPGMISSIMMAGKPNKFCCKLCTYYKHSLMTWHIYLCKVTSPRPSKGECLGPWRVWVDFFNRSSGFFSEWNVVSDNAVTSVLLSTLNGGVLVVLVMPVKNYLKWWAIQLAIYSIVL